MDTGLLKQGKAQQIGQHRLKQYKEAMITLSPSSFSIIIHPSLRMLHLFAQNRGVSYPPSINKSTKPSQLSGCICYWRPVAQYKWYSPASESACCYGNTSHLTCSHANPASCELAMVPRKKKKKKDNREDKSEDRVQEENWCSDRYICTLMICWSNKAHVYRLSNEESLDEWLKNDIKEIFLLVVTYAGMKSHRMA